MDFFLKIIIFGKNKFLLRKKWGCFLIFILCSVHSLWSSNQNTLNFSVSYGIDFNQKETIESISKRKLIPFEGANLGFKNGVYWFKVFIPEKTNSDIVFEFPNRNVSNFEIYNNQKIIPYTTLNDSHFSLLVNTDSLTNTYFFRVNFNKGAYFPLHIKSYEPSQIEDKYVFFINGAYYGFVVMVLMINFFFYFSLKDRTFLFYCAFLTAVTITILDFDGLLNVFLPDSFSGYNILLIHSLVPFFGALLANQFLNVNYYVPKGNKVGLLLVVMAVVCNFLFIPTQNYLFVAIANTFSLFVLLNYWIIGIIMLKKHEFARFFVLGYSLILFSAFLFVIPMDWGLNTLTVSLNALKFGSIFEMLILTYAITYRVTILQKENEQYKQEIQDYLVKINRFETINTTDNPIENLIIQHQLSEREADVLQLIFKGYTNKRIGDELHISLNTVKFHIRNIYEKLDISTKNEAIDIFTKITHYG